MNERLSHQPERKPERPKRNSRILAAVLAATLSGAIKETAEAKAPRKSHSIEHVKREKMRTIAPKHGLRGIVAERLIRGLPLFTLETVGEAVRKAEHEYRIPSGRKTVDSARERMAPYEEEIRRIFAEHGVPEWCMYLTIVESGFDNERVSSAGATGVFQFTYEAGKTARLVRRETDPDTKERKEIDERKDIVKSAEAAAKLLLHNYRVQRPQAQNDHDAWLLAVSQYNGSFSYQYADLENTTSYPGFVQYMDARMYDRISIFRHERRTGDTWESLARRFFVSEERLKQANASAELPGEVIIPAIELSDLWYEAKRGDTVSGIARWLGTTTPRLLEMNPEMAKPRFVLQAGARLRIPAEAKGAKELAAAQNLQRIGGIIENAEYVPKIAGLLRSMHARGLIAIPIPTWKGTRFVEEKPDRK